MKKHITFLLLMAVLVLTPTSCRKEILNPNAATDTAVLTSTDGLLGMIVGLKREYSVGALGAYYNTIAANGLTTKELYVINTGNGELAALETGKTNLGAANTFITNIFASCNTLKANAQLLIDNSRNASDPNVAAMISGYGHLFRALALGTMSQFWEQVPVEVITSTQFLEGKRAAFEPRDKALLEAIASLDKIQVPAPIPAIFTQKVGNDINLAESAKALKARYAAMRGDWATAKAAAASVSATSRSIFKHEAPNSNQNPVFRISLTTNNVFNGIFNFGLTGALAPDSTDGRIAHYYNANTAGNAKVGGFWKADDTAVPLYLPSEMVLIQAEAEARGSSPNLNAAIGHINTIRKKTTDPFNVTAKGTDYSGPATTDAVLTEIYRQRCIELYMSGMKLEDSRRFNRPGPNDTGAERNRNWYPYPQRERDNNPNTPADPAI